MSAAGARVGARRRSREGAWIEIGGAIIVAYSFAVAPVRERGLKYEHPSTHPASMSRSREGAWIEIGFKRLPLVGTSVAPVRERGLKFVL